MSLLKDVLIAIGIAVGVTVAAFLPVIATLLWWGGYS